jgi:hypothetical protein
MSKSRAILTIMIYNCEGPGPPRDVRTPGLIPFFSARWQHEFARPKGRYADRFRCLPALEKRKVQKNPGKRAWSGESLWKASYADLAAGQRRRPPPIFTTTVASTSAGATADIYSVCAVPTSPPPRRQHTGAPPEVHRSVEACRRGRGDHEHAQVVLVTAFFTGGGDDLPLLFEGSSWRVPLDLLIGQSSRRYLTC